ncbi:Hypothetical protein DPCES_0862 [Desulfitobacterium hafniense]|uniref:Uncharacterized protein n=1 Tax=Desulfitobacterium hafniense TaxID=49338 RepID=A0A098AVX6_DESHA|nr:hypothetical protein [Desulfitobacterium hafniense]CDX00749.1 Hypothetical protein DPCES_0862 [Desulfitobacterium hafniense]
MTLYEKMKVKLYEAVGNVNSCADRKDVERNRVNYGIATTTAYVLRELGHDVQMSCWEDDGYLKIPRLTLNGDLTEF